MWGMTEDRNSKADWHAPAKGATQCHISARPERTDAVGHALRRVFYARGDNRDFDALLAEIDRKQAITRATH